LSYKDRKISTHKRNLLLLIRQLADGEFLIPTFQRLFIWDAESIRALWDSIYRCYPIGTLLYWKTDIRLHVHRKVGGFYIPDTADAPPSHWSYILDGQQRATSLLAAFHGGTGKIRENPRFDFTLYFNLQNGSFFFERDYYRHRWDTDGSLLLRLKDVPDLPEDYCRRLPGVSKGVEGNFRQLQHIFAHYDVPLIRLEGFDIASVCGVFERINQSGIRLSHTDILISRSFRNSGLVVEEDFPVR
jgi:uncharacterized protein with ParB-like and HNH nuclease domain